MRRVLGALAVTLLVGASAHAQQCKVTKAGYDSLETADSYAEAVRKLGCKGEEVSSSEIGGMKTVMYQWMGSGLGANMNAMFQDDELVSKAQFGLK